MSTSLVPHCFLFRLSIPVRKIDKLPLAGERLLNLAESCRIPDLGGLEGRKTFGDLRMAWNHLGLGLACAVRGKKKAIVGRQPMPTLADRLRLWIDTRNTQNIHRASRFCHEFHLYPQAGSGSRLPVVESRVIERAREMSPTRDMTGIQTAVEFFKDGYCLEVWFPAAVLNGFDPGEQSQLGFFYHLRDQELGSQYLTVGQEFPFDFDPSLWQTLDLVRN